MSSIPFVEISMPTQVAIEIQYYLTPMTLLTVDSAWCLVSRSRAVYRRTAADQSELSGPEVIAGRILSSGWGESVLLSAHDIADG